jgi:hypothetical protein
MIAQRPPVEQAVPTLALITLFVAIELRQAKCWSLDKNS